MIRKLGEAATRANRPARLPAMAAPDPVGFGRGRAVNRDRKMIRFRIHSVSGYRVLERVG